MSDNLSTPGSIWSCKIGTREETDIPAGSDCPMRRAVERAFREVAGADAEFIFSGWSAKLDEQELAVVENRLPSAQHYRDHLIREAAPDLYEAVKALVVAIDYPDRRDTAYIQGRAALAKARGEQS